MTQLKLRRNQISQKSYPNKDDYVQLTYDLINLVDEMLEYDPPLKLVVLTHGNNAECPNVKAGEWRWCKGHERYE